MAKDIFQREAPVFNGAFSADMVKVSFPAAGVDQAGLIAQRIVLNYTMNINRLYDITENKIYFVANRPEGTLEMTHVVGPSVILAAFYETYGNICSALNNNITLSGAAGCIVGNKKRAQFSYTAAHCVVSQLSIDIQANEAMLINEGVRMTIGALYYGAGSKPKASGALLV